MIWSRPISPAYAAAAATSALAPMSTVDDQVAHLHGGNVDQRRCAHLGKHRHPQRFAVLADREHHPTPRVGERLGVPVLEGERAGGHPGPAGPPAPTSVATR